MITYLSADYVFPIHLAPIKNGVVAINNENEIIDIYSVNDHRLKGQEIREYKGIITPGFINSHCHLELSHLHKKISPKTGLVPFLQQVINQAKVESSEITTAMKNADAQMLKNGIVAVADIVNTSVSKEIKSRSELYYHTFVETICLEPEKVSDVFKKGVELCESFYPMSASITAHAPYSACKDLLRYLKVFCKTKGNIISIHNQESDEENRFYRYKAGDFISFYEKLNKDIDFFKPLARNSIQSIIPLLPKNEKILLVHNTYTSYKDIHFIERYGSDVTWCFCPNANLYIEDRLPKIDLFLQSEIPIVLGTDSLASNDSLSILSEIKTLHSYFPDLNLDQTVAWATLNGARYLGIDDVFGSFEVGKRPGINLIKNTEEMSITPDSIIEKLA